MRRLLLDLWFLAGTLRLKISIWDTTQDLLKLIHKNERIIYEGLLLYKESPFVGENERYGRVLLWKSLISLDIIAHHDRIRNRHCHQITFAV